MTIESRHKIDPDLMCVFVRRVGAFRPGGLLDAVLAACGDPAFRIGMNFLVDARAVDYSSAVSRDIAPFSEHWKALDRRIGPCKIALLHSRPLSYGVSRMTGTLLETPGIQRQQFYALEEASTWLGLPPATAFPDLG